MGDRDRRKKGKSSREGANTEVSGNPIREGRTHHPRAWEEKPRKSEGRKEETEQKKIGLLWRGRNIPLTFANHPLPTPTGEGEPRLPKKKRRKTRCLRDLREGKC